MNKFYLDGLLVVEGKNDVSFLSSFIDTDFFITNGYDLSIEKIAFLKEVKKRKKIFLLLDPDEAGRNIEKILLDLLPSCIPILVDITKCNKHKKHGIAECKKEEIIRVLSPFFEKKTNVLEEITLKDLISIGAFELDNWNKIKEHYCLNNLNTKSTIKRLNVLGIKIDEIRKVIEYGNK